jgi:hypothetical protein
MFEEAVCMIYLIVLVVVAIIIIYVITHGKNEDIHWQNEYTSKPNDYSLTACIKCRKRIKSIHKYCPYCMFDQTAQVDEEAESETISLPPLTGFHKQMKELNSEYKPFVSPDEIIGAWMTAFKDYNDKIYFFFCVPQYSPNSKYRKCNVSSDLMGLLEDNCKTVPYHVFGDGRIFLNNKIYRAEYLIVDENKFMTLFDSENGDVFAVLRTL